MRAIVWTDYPYNLAALHVWLVVAACSGYYVTPGDWVAWLVGSVLGLAYFTR